MGANTNDAVSVDDADTMPEAAPEQSRAKPPLPTWRRVTLWVGRAAFVVAAVPTFAYLLSWEAGPLVWLIAVLPWFVIPAALAVVLHLVGREWLSGAISVLWVYLLVITQAPLFSATTYSPALQPAATVATLNMRFGEADPDAIVAMVRDQDIQVLALVEITHDAVDALDAAGLGELLPYSVDASTTLYQGAALYSATPIEDPAVHGGMVSNAVSGTIRMGGSSVDVWVAHPMVPGLRSHAAWSEDFDLLAHWLSDVESPAMLLGDFNATLDHSGPQALEDLGWSDAVDDAGAGFLPTFPANSAIPPLVAIDHIMASSDVLTATDVTTVTIPGTDHLALVASYVGP